MASRNNPSENSRQSQQMSNSTPRQNSQKDQTSDLINKYSQTLDNSASALKTAALSFNKTSKELSSDYKKTTDYLIQMMVKTAKTFGKDVSDLEDSMKRRTRDDSDQEGKVAKQNQRTIDELDKLHKSNLSSLQRYGGAFIKSVELVGTALLNRYKTAANNVLSSYESHFSDITVRMFNSNSDYTEAMKDATRQISSMDLTKQFSQIDFTEQLATVLESGIRKSSDSQLDITNTVMSNLITSKLTPYISTNTRTYTRMTKLLGENFTQGMTGLATTLEDKYGAEGLEQGQFDATLEAFGNMMQANAKQSGEDVNRALSAAVEMNDRIANLMGSEESDRWRSLITEISETGTSSDAVMLAAMQKAGVYNAADISDSDKLQRLTTMYYDMVRANTSAAWGGQYSQSLGTSAQTIWATQGANSLESLSDPLTKTYESLNAYTEKQEALTEGYGQSKSAQYDKEYENSVSTGVDTLADKVPHALDNLDLIYKVVLGWSAAWTARGLIGGGDSGSGVLGGLASKAIRTNGRAASVLSKLPEGLPTLGLGSAVGAGTATVGGILTGVTGLVTGTAMAGVDAYQAGSRASANEQGVGQTILQGARGALTGSSTAGMTEQQKQEYYQQQGYFSWKDVGTNALKGGALGAGIGTAAGGWALGTGTAVGAVIGAATGALTNIIDQVADAHDYKQLEKASEEASESLSNLKQASSNYESTLKKSDDTLSNLDTIQENLGKSTSATEDAFTALKKEYPEYLTGLTSSTEVNQDLIDVMKERVRAENLKALKDAQEAGEEASEDERKKLDKDIKVATKDSISDVSQAFYTENKGKTLSSTELNKWVEGYSKRSGKSIASIADQLHKEGAYSRHGLVNQSFEVSNFEGKSTITQSLNKTIADYLGSDSVLSELYGRIVESYNNLYDSEGNPKEGLSDPDKLQYTGLLEGFASQFKETYYSEKAKFKDKDEEAAVNFKKEAQNLFGDNLPSMLKAGGVENFSYKLGTDRVTKDQTAQLHQNEAVLTAATATKLRDLSKGMGGISNYVDLLSQVQAQPVQKATTLSSASTDSPIYTLLSTYTKSVTDSLSSLVSMVSKLVDIDESDFPEPVVNKKLASYKGA